MDTETGSPSGGGPLRGTRIAIGEFSHLFEVPNHIAYFNTADNTPSLRASRKALEAAAGAKSRPWERTPANFFHDAEAVRQRCASLGGRDRSRPRDLPAVATQSATVCVKLSIDNPPAAMTLGT